MDTHTWITQTKTHLHPHTDTNPGSIESVFQFAEAIVTEVLAMSTLVTATLITATLITET